MIWDTSELLLFFIAIVALAVSSEAGFQLGLRHHATKELLGPHIGALQTALLGLLALLLGFTFSMSIERFDSRKELVLEEANAIGTTYLRARFLPEEQSRLVGDLLRDYVKARLRFHAHSPDPALLAQASADAERVLGTLWRLTVDLSRDRADSVPFGLFVQALNDTIDINEKRRVALENHVPEAVVLLLFAASMVSIGFIGFSQGLTGQRRVYSTATFAVLIALVLTIILDIDRPRRGMIKVSQGSLERVLDGFERDAAAR